MSERKEKFTPGPWEVKDNAEWDEILVLGKSSLPFGELRVAVIGQDEEEGLADAALIAAAPDMYAAREKAIADYGKPGGPWNVPSEPGTWIHSARAALAKARGES
jgi:hypothetical protein